ncbi:hypothetical protein [Actinocrispum sp. NPDC049592]|uniref:hypothetical protein n=1 Tax=Actinocrispum sp. NPDC049592 TaxID=3154835 RepID=UPI0034483C89
MNEQELRDGLRDAMAASSPPPPMSPTSALDAAHRAHRRRRARWAGAGAAAAVAALAAGAVLAVNRGPAELPIVDPAAGAKTTAAGKTQPQWPDGQTDRTARNGPRAEKSAALLQALTTALPPTLGVDTDLKYPQSKDPVTAPQSQYIDTINGKQIWEYMATAEVYAKAAPNAGSARLVVQVRTPGNTDPADPCALAKSFWGAGGTCVSKDMQGKKVGVATSTEQGSTRQTAAYRYSDGTTVFASQSVSPRNNMDPGGGMTTPPLTVDQLCAFVLTPGFQLG